MVDPATAAAAISAGVKAIKDLGSMFGRDPKASHALGEANARFNEFAAVQTQLIADVATRDARIRELNAALDACKTVGAME